MMAKRSKQVPPYVAARKTVKSPAVSADYTSPKDLRPVWRVDLLQREGPYGWQAVTGSLLWTQIIPKLRNFETMTWSEVLGRQNHPVRVASLCPEAQKRLKALKLDDVEELVSLRLSGKERVWGLRERAELRLLWWDPDHQVCPSTKKHT